MNDRQAEVLDFAASRYGHRGQASNWREAERIRAVFGLSSTRFQQVLTVLLDDPGAYMARPQWIRRHREIREATDHARRGGRQLGPATANRYR